MNRALVAYMSRSGSTREVATFIGRELSSQGLDVDVQPISNVGDLSPYNFVIAGGLIYRFGWHPEVVRFLQKNVDALRKKKVALFVVGLRLMKTPDCDQAAFPIFIDPAIMKGPKERKNLLDSITTMKYYLHAALPAIDKIKPISLAFFAGRLNLRYLSFSEKLIMAALMLFIGKRSGDYRNWEMIDEWTKELNFAASNIYQREKVLVG